MHSCTLAHASPRLLLAAAPDPARAPLQRRYGGLAGLRAGRDARCSAAGLARRTWLGRLRRALREERFVLHYQPIVSLRDGRISHHEALVRLSDGAGGRLLAPRAFLPAAERSGVVCDIDRMVVDRVSGVLARSRKRNTRIAVNLSALSVTDAGMLTHIHRCLLRHRVRPSRLLVEITETASICDLRQAREFCEGLRALGCEVALDDFGAGFGAFHYLKHLPFSYLKIDGDFITALTSSADDRLVVDALVRLGRGMGFATIAEFVTDQDTQDLLAQLGVDYAQGFHLGRPSAALPA
jgi:EAL domain-containing protein (putative c-di-GMP-specific phosphodiesterase class I)